MNAEEIRQKAIECSKTSITQRCCNPCNECEYGEYFLSMDVSCTTLYGYEHGFADGVEEERRRIYEEYQKAVKADSEASIHGDMFPKNEERFWQEMRGKYENR